MVEIGALNQREWEETLITHSHLHSSSPNPLLKPKPRAKVGVL